MFSVLIVDDDPLFRRLTRRMLRDAAHIECLEASGVVEATALLRQHKPTVLLTDLQLQDGVGVDLLEALPRLSLETLPILMSGVASLRDYQSALRLGAVDVLTKPFTRDELLVALQRALDSATGFRGVVHGLLLADLLQMLHLASRSLVLEVRGPLYRGEIVFHDGQIIHAEVGSFRGIEALQRLFSLQAGTIHTHPFRPTARTIDAPFQEALMDAFREVDEAQREPPTRLSSAPPPTSAAPSLRDGNDEILAFLRALDPELGGAWLDTSPADLLVPGSVPPSRWEPLARAVQALVAPVSLGWHQLLWTSEGRGLALLRPPHQDRILLLAQNFSGKLDDRRFRWNISRMERFLRNQSSV